MGISVESSYERGQHAATAATASNPQGNRFPTAEDLVDASPTIVDGPRPTGLSIAEKYGMPARRKPGRRTRPPRHPLSCFL
jgi:hypothetical protein